jgi:hypothetical protein
MKLKDEEDQSVEINFQNFDQILCEKHGFVLVKFKNGIMEWVRATTTAVLEAAVEENKEYDHGTKNGDTDRRDHRNGYRRHGYLSQPFTS